MQSFQDVIGLWKTPDQMAADVGAKVETARKWKQRDRIPPEYWQRIIDAARLRGMYVSADDLARIAATKQPEAAE